MSEFMAASFDGIDTGGTPREDLNKITEEAVSRVQEQAKQAKQVAQQIQRDKDINQKLAQFLTFLLQAIQSDVITSTLYNTFFKVTNPKNNITYLRKNINTLVIVGIFIPFYPDYAQRFGLTPIYQSIYNFQTIRTLPEYLSHLQKISATFHDNIPIDKKNFLDFLWHIVQYYQLVSLNGMEEEQKIQIYQQLAQQLYGTPALS